MFKIQQNQSGASLTELAVCLPLVLILISGLIDYGMALRTIEVISSATKHGARVAAAYAGQPSGPPRNCVRNPLHDPDSPCSGSTSPLNCEDPNYQASLECLSLDETKKYLSQAHLNPEDWVINPRVCTSGAGLLENQVIEVKLSRSPNAQNCLLCMHHWFGSNFESSSSSFALEGGC